MVKSWMCSLLPRVWFLNHAVGCSSTDLCFRHSHWESRRFYIVVRDKRLLHSSLALTCHAAAPPSLQPRQRNRAKHVTGEAMKALTTPWLPWICHFHNECRKHRALLLTRGENWQRLVRSMVLKVPLVVGLRKQRMISHWVFAGASCFVNDIAK